MIKPYERQFFDAFFWQSKVPVRVIDKTGNVMVFHALIKTRKYLSPPDMSLLKRCNEPQILRVGQHELLAVMPLRGQYVVLGPVLIVDPETIPSLYELTLIGDAVNDHVNIRDVLPVLSPTMLCAYLRIVSLALLRRDVHTNKVLEKSLNVSAKEINRDIVKARFDSIERQRLSSLDLRDEREVLDAIREGDFERVKNFRIDLEKYNLGGFMSENQMRNYKYLGVCIASMMSMAASNGGLSDLDIYVLCGTYVQHIDLAETNAQIFSMLYTMMQDICERVAKVRAAHPYTKPVAKAVAYIKSHTHQRLTVQEVADAAGISKDVLYREFTKQTGMSPSHYIQHTKMEEAKDLLTGTAFSATEIAAYLDFSSQSHFIDVFKKHTGMTPKEYRAK